MSEEPEQTVDDLEHRSEALKKDIEDTKGDWERKQESAAVPGAVPEETDASAEDGDADDAGTPEDDADDADPPDDDDDADEDAGPDDG